MMPTRLALIFALSLVPLAGASAQNINIEGIWARGDGNARVRIGPCGSKICATNVWIKDPSGGEEVGDRLVMDLDGRGAVRKGTAFDPKRDMSFRMELSVNGNRMTTKGCVFAGLLCRDVAWTRVN